MTEQTNLAELLSRMLGRLEKHMPTRSGTGTPLSGAWRLALGTQANLPLSDIEGIARVAFLLSRLKGQVSASQRCTESTKVWAVETLKSFDCLFSLTNMMQDAHNFAGATSPGQRGALEGVGHALQPEYPETTIEKSEAEQLSADLTSLIKTVQSSRLIPLGLRQSFNRQAGIILWWLSNPDSASVQQMVESAGSTVVVARQIAEDAQSRGADASAVGLGIYQKALDATKKLATYVNLGNRGVQAVAELSHEVHGLLETAQQALPPQ